MREFVAYTFVIVFICLMLLCTISGFFENNNKEVK